VIEGALPAARAVHFTAMLLIEGCVVFDVLFASGTREPAFRTFLIRTIAAAWIAAVASGLAWWLLLAANIAGSSVGDALADGTAWTLLTDTQFGWDWLARAAGFLLIAILIWRKPRAREGVLLIALSVALTGSLAWSGHGAATTGANGVIHLAADILHLITAGLWLGGLLPFAMLLMTRPETAPETARRFSALATACVLVLVASGIVNAAMTLDAIDALTGTVYGRLLLAKVALFALMLAFAGVNRVVLTPRLASSNADNARARLVIHSGCEIALGLAVLGIVGVLGTIAPVEEHHGHQASTVTGALSPAPGPRSGRSSIAIRNAMPQAATNAQAA